MAHYDEATRDFISKVSGQDGDKKEEKAPYAVKQIVGLASDLSKGKGNIEAALAKRLVRVATRATASSLEKTSGVKVLGIYDLLNGNYSSDWWDWEPETLWQTLEMEHAVTPSEEVKNLVQALQVTCKTDFPFEDFSVFENVGHAFNMNPVYFGKIQPLEPDEAALTIKLLEHIRPQAGFEDEVLGYVAACAKRAGMVYLPNDLFPSEAQEFLDRLDNNLELKQKVLNNSSGEDVDIQKERIQEVREYVGEHI